MTTRDQMPEPEQILIYPGKLGANHLPESVVERLVEGLVTGMERADLPADFETAYLNAIRALVGYDGVTADKIKDLADQRAGEALTDEDRQLVFTIGDEAFTITVVVIDDVRCAVIQHVDSDTVLWQYPGEASEAWAKAIANESYARMRARRWLQEQR